MRVKHARHLNVLLVSTGRRPGGGRRSDPRPPAPAAPRWADRRADAMGLAPRCHPARSSGRAGADRGSAPPPAGGACRRCCGSLEHRLARADLDDLAEIHHRHAVADPLHHRHVVRDEQIRHAQPRLQLHQQVHHLRADRHVQRRHRFVGDDQPWLGGQRTRDAARAAAARRTARADSAAHVPAAARPAAAARAPAPPPPRPRAADACGSVRRWRSRWSAADRARRADPGTHTARRAAAGLPRAIQPRHVLARSA